jgi:hypothetical protein
MKYATFLLLLVAACSNKVWYSDLSSGEVYSASRLTKDSGGFVVVLSHKSGAYVEIPLGKDPKEGAAYRIEKLGRPIRVGSVHVGFEHVTSYHHGTIELFRFDGKSAKGSFRADRRPSPISGSFKASRP